MKIIIISHYPPITGGISLYTKKIVDELRKKKQNVLPIGIDSFSEVLKVWNNISKFKPELIRIDYSISMYGLLSLPLLLILFTYKLCYKTILIVNFHEVTRDIELLNILGVFYYRIISLFFDKIHTHIHKAEGILIQRCKINQKKIKVIPHPLFKLEHLIKINEGKLRHHLNLDEKKILLYFGYIHVDKGIEYLLNAYKNLVTEDPQFLNSTQLVIAGTIRVRKGIMKFFEKKDFDYLQQLYSIKCPNVKFLGYIEDKYVSLLFESSTITIIPYTKTEQSGVLSQALLAKKPIIASRIGGLEETLNDTGILVTPKSAEEIQMQIKSLLNNNNYYSTFNNKYMRLEKKLNISRIIDESIEEYQKLVEHI